MTFKGMNIILVDDDEHTILKVKRYCVEMGITLSTFKDSLQAMTFVIQQPIDLLIVKNQLKYFKGLNVAQEFRKEHPSTPILLLKEESDKKTIYEDAMKIGVNEFLSKPFNYIEFKLRIENLLKLRQQDIILNDKTKLLKTEIEEATSDMQEEEFEILEILEKTTEYKDHNIGMHVSRVAQYSRLIAEKYGLTKRHQNIIYHAAPLHDIGKVGIPDILLQTSRKLTDEEFELMKKHTLIGYDILKNSTNEFLSHGAIIALTHHERYDGSGYPKGLKSHHIPIEGRIVALADVFDNLTSDRPYKKAWSFEEAVESIKNNSGKHFDPELVDIFLENINYIKSIFNSFSK
ncbi:HD domain-containing phosphohydrolase [Sulfurimonas sp.]|uniref:HD domain-containing phosphohydrolase n=1 Tax=Sulfurimonas sp. TaxID=2022749 RepID=UPI00356871A2